MLKAFIENLVIGVGVGPIRPIRPIRVSSVDNVVFDNDEIVGSSSNVYYGGLGNDEIVGSSSNVYYGGLGNDEIVGSSGYDTIYDDQGGDDILNGGAGDDILAGGNGNDVLWGGTGADRFVYSSPSEGIDIIKDYSYLEGDRITVSKTGFGASSTNQFSYNSITGALFFQGTQFLTLENKPADFSTNLSIELV